MMTRDEFAPMFEELSKAFHVQKFEDKAQTYHKHLHQISPNVFRKVIHKAIQELDKFPTIMKLIELSRPMAESQKTFECSDCEGTGQISKWSHGFRCRCLNGERISKQIALVPVSIEEKKYWYGRLNRDWNECYGKDLVEGKSYQGEKEPDIISKAKELFGII